MTRGTAMANELARALNGAGLQTKLGEALKTAVRKYDVNFLGLFDPVYSFDQPGQGSSMVTLIPQRVDSKSGTVITPSGKDANAVTTTITGNVRNAVVYHAGHETRTWFPATHFSAESADTRIRSVRGFGGHGDAGGHWQNNLAMAQLTLHGMAKYAIDSGSPIQIGGSGMPAAGAVVHVARTG